MISKNLDHMSEGVVWTSTLDNRFRVTVTRTAPYRGELVITSNGEVLHRAEVGLMYDALFGPDVTDVAEWQETAIAFVDENLNRPGSSTNE
jgi:hypothetical protein